MCSEAPDEPVKQKIKSELAIEISWVTSLIQTAPLPALSVSFCGALQYRKEEASTRISLMALT